MANAERVRGDIQLVRELSNELAAYFHSLPEEVWREADKYPSGCDQWKMADVVAHLIMGAIESSLSVARGLKGDTSPPMGHRPMASQEAVDRVIALRAVYDEDLFPEFNATCKRLNTLLVSLRPEHYERMAWRPRAVSPVSRLIEYRLVELAVHGWDIRYGIDRSANLNPKTLPFLTQWMCQWFRAGFQPREPLERPVRYRFLLNDPATESYDVIVSGDDFRLVPSEETDADATFCCDTDSYILFGMGRLPFSRSVRRGRLLIEGDEELASQFTTWFKPL